MSAQVPLVQSRMKRGKALTVTQITNPRLQSRRVVLMDYLAVGLDGGFAGNGSPLAVGVEETNVDVRVVLEVVSLTALGVGMED